MRQLSALRCACLLFLLSMGRGMATRAAESSGDGEPIHFERHVRPILKTHCFHCHGEGGKREAELDLRLRRWIVEGGESGPAVTPGKPADSYLLRRVVDGEMPPDKESLSTGEIDIIRRWIEQGAATAREEPETIGDEPLLTEEDLSFWSFQPIRRPPLPAVADGRRVATPVDAFILARLESAGLGFSEEADRATLIRRASFDLLGMPPTPEQIEQFVGDPAADAYSRMLDRLLASPRYGEHWGRHWLDVAGYADSEGYSEDDAVRPWAFRYRDYVIRAFNKDLPFDQFVREQLAGDEMVKPPYRNLSADDIDKLTATGLLRMGPDGTAAAGVDQDVARNEVLADTLQIVSSAFMGLTVGCARCHDHRYDPISQLDYYRLRALLEPAYDWKAWRPPAARLISLSTDEDRRQAAAIEAEARQVDQQREEKTAFYIERTLTEELETLAEELRQPLRDAYRTAAAKRTPEQNELLKQHPTVAAISAGSLYLYDRRREERARKLDQDRKAKEQRFVEEARRMQLEQVAAELRDEVTAAGAANASARTDRQRQLLRQFPGVLVNNETLERFHPTAAEELRRDRDAAERLRSEKAADDLKRYSEKAAEIRARIAPEQFMRALTEPPDHAPPTYLFHRGDHAQQKQQVEAGELAVLAWTNSQIPLDDPDLPTTGRRLAYARHLTSGRHPLLARVIVNRIWMEHFGAGLVNTPADFGTLGDRPSHPELLDWLADEFQRGGWQVKHLHRLLMGSTTYRQVSRRTERLDALDPDNRLYGRMTMRRLSSEAIRDSVLQVSGRLNDQMYGSPVPVMEDEVGQIVLGRENLDGERKPTKAIPLNGQEFRRSLYVQVRRSRPLAVLEAFDAPDTTPNCPQRSASNVAPQSLVLMNSQFVVEYSRHFAERVVRDGLVPEADGDGDEWPVNPRGVIRRAWMLAWGRKPTDAESEAAADYLRSQAEVFRSQGDAKQQADAELLALSTLCQLLLSANQFIYVD